MDDAETLKFLSSMSTDEATAVLMDEPDYRLGRLLRSISVLPVLKALQHWELIEHGLQDWMLTLIISLIKLEEGKADLLTPEGKEFAACFLIDALQNARTLH